MKRIVNLDLLRGFVIFLALWQHFAVFLNYWFLIYFPQDNFLIENFYESFNSLIGFFLPADIYTTTANYIFAPWVTHIYLTLACFNLAKYNYDDFKSILFNKKVKIFISIIFLFAIESFIVGPTIGHSISFLPIFAWIAILILIAVFYNYFNYKGVVFLLFLSLTRWIIPELNLGDNFESMVQNYIHPYFSYNARIEYFLTSGCIGFLLGYQFWHSKVQYLNMFCVSLLMILPYIFIGEVFIVNENNLFENEYQLAKDFIGSVYIWGMQIFIISFFLLLEKKNIKIKLPIITWIGKNSLLVFFTHRIFILHIGGPLLFYSLHHFFNLPPENNTLYIFILIFVCFLFCKYIKTYNPFKVLTKF